MAITLARTLGVRGFVPRRPATRAAAPAIAEAAIAGAQFFTIAGRVAPKA